LGKYEKRFRITDCGDSKIKNENVKKRLFDFVEFSSTLVPLIQNIKRTYEQHSTILGFAAER